MVFKSFGHKTGGGSVSSSDDGVRTEHLKDDYYLSFLI
jgi:hypothetical protein